VGSRVRGAAVLLASLVGAFGLAGCADDDPPAPEPSDSAASSSEPPSASPSGSAGTEDVASGPVVDAGVLSYRLPEGKWDLGNGGLDAFWEGDTRTWVISGTAETAFAGTTIADIARVTLELEADHDPPLRRTGFRTVSGVRGYVIEGHGPAGYYYEWGTVTDGHYVQLEFEFPEDSARAEEWTEQVLASVEWQ